MDTAPLVEALYAIGIGLVVGLEREHSGATHGLDAGAVPAEHYAAARARRADPAPADPTHDGEDGEPHAPDVALDRPQAFGARTLALLGLLGWLLAFLGDREPWLVPLGLIAIVALCGAQMYVNRDVGMTTEVAAVVVVLLGALVHRDRALAVALCLGTTLLLVSKPWMQRFVGQLRRIEITATLQLLLLAAIVLPLLPSDPVDPWDALPPRKVGTFIVLIAGVQYVGYVLTRLLGATRGTGIAGLVGGLTSSTAVTVSMARSARQEPKLTRAGQLATFLANTVMPVRVAIIAGAISAPVGWRLALAMGVMAAVLLAAALVTWRRLARDDQSPGAIPLKNPFQLWNAAIWGAVLCAVLLVSKLATTWFGDEGFLIAAGLSGITDVDAITLAAAEQHRAGAMAVDIAALAIVIAVCVNTVVKGAMAWFGGGRGFGRTVVLVFAGAIVLTVAAAVVGMVVRTGA